MLRPSFPYKGLGLLPAASLSLMRRLRFRLALGYMLSSDGRWARLQLDYVWPPVHPPSTCRPHGFFSKPKDKVDVGQDCELRPLPLPVV